MPIEKSVKVLILMGGGRRGYSLFSEASYLGHFLLDFNDMSKEKAKSNKQICISDLILCTTWKLASINYVNSTFNGGKTLKTINKNLTIIAFVIDSF